MTYFFQRAFLLLIAPLMLFVDLFDTAEGRAIWRKAWWSMWRDCPMKWRDI